ncbi:MAG: YdcF family protein [Rickettsiaceae bacterium]
MNNKDKFRKSDALVVLANLMDVKGALNFESIVRAKKAVEIFNEQNIPYLVTCGWAYMKGSDIRIADAFKHYLVETLGVDPKKIITELNSRDTVGDAFFSKTTIATPLSWRNICVVTSDYHVERTREIFNFIYGHDFFIDVCGAEVRVDNSTITNELSSIKAFRKTFSGVEIGNDTQILRRLREVHPFYNGQIYPKI